LKIFIDNTDKQNHFVTKYRKVKNLYEFLSPDPFLKTYLRQFEWLTSFYLAYLKEFRSEDDRYLLEEYGEKVRKLIEQSDIIDYEGITKNFRELRVDDLYTLERLKGMDEEEKALNLEKMLKQEISIDINDDPTYVKFSERLKAIRDEFENSQIDLAERIRRYEELMKDIRTKRDEAKELGMDLKEYALFIISQEFAPDSEQLRAFIKAVKERLEDVLDKDWQDSTKRDVFIKDVKQTLQELILRDYRGIVENKDFPKFLNRLVDVVTKKF